MNNIPYSLDGTMDLPCPLSRCKDGCIGACLPAPPVKAACTMCEWIKGASVHPSYAADRMEGPGHTCRDVPLQRTYRELAHASPGAVINIDGQDFIVQQATTSARTHVEPIYLTLCSSPGFLDYRLPDDDYTAKWKHIRQGRRQALGQRLGNTTFTRREMIDLLISGDYRVA